MKKDVNHYFSTYSLGQEADKPLIQKEPRESFDKKEEKVEKAGALSGLPVRATEFPARRP